MVATSLEDFIASFKDQFDFADGEPDMNGETKFKELDDWDSLVALSVIALADSKYQVTLTGADIRDSQTIGELYQLIVSKQQ